MQITRGVEYGIDRRYPVRGSFAQTCGDAAHSFTVSLAALCGSRRARL